MKSEEFREIELCGYSQCPLKDKCVRYMEEIDSDWIRFGKYPYNEKKNKCTFFISCDDVRLDQRIIDNILERIKGVKDVTQNQQ